MAAHLPASDEDQERPLISNRFVLRLTIAIAIIACLTVAIGIGGQWFGGRIALAGHTESTAPLSIEIGQDRLAIPANTIRFPEQRRDGQTERLDIYLTWPEMQGYSRAERLRFDDVTQPSSLIFLQMSEGTMSRDMSGRLSPIYARLFEGQPEQGPSGLTLHRLRKDSGYGSEVVLTGPEKGADTYVVRCLLPAAGEAATSSDCQRDVLAGDNLSVLYRFSSSQLKDWQRIDIEVHAFVRNHLADTTQIPAKGR
ncbi:MAG: hypothetical protein PW791_10520 [Neorhizobium sp.]|nr:hypothetical protein [Neorhizobium sp.]